MNQAMTDYYRCPQEALPFSLQGTLSHHPGFFRFGSGLLCFGACSSSSPAPHLGPQIPDVFLNAKIENGRVLLPFDPTEVASNYRLERYKKSAAGPKSKLLASAPVHDLYYLLRPLFPVSFRKHLQRIYFRGWKSRPFPQWPLDSSVDALFERLLTLALQARGGEPIPFVWFWPDALPAAFILTHDVEEAAGRDFCPALMDLDASFGFRASFQLVPEERYSTSDSFRASIRDRGFEVCVHDLNHDGRLYHDHAQFLRRAAKINEYARQWQSRGFRAGAMYRNLDWLSALDFSYDMSVPSSAHLEPQSGGACTVMPFFVGKILELPLTMAQDYSLFDILDDYSIDVWRGQAAHVLSRNGLLSLITHPDYLLEDRARRTYSALLAHLAELRDSGRLWAALPGEVDRWWRDRNKMEIVRSGDGWRVQGPGSGRARVALAQIEEGKLVYRFPHHD
ncbi:MAG: hypothetical protein LAN71_00470 [Acidobacteriia bacterium]|nr:hypothetical protein [Terriglobia bacterium]